MAKIQSTLDKNQALHKKAYIKPKVSTIELVPEDAVLGTCKDNTGSNGFDLCRLALDNLCVSAPRS